ncbi:MAG: hypothetical protein WCO26_00545 [Deltaproteobacteria bacterium]
MMNDFILDKTYEICKQIASAEYPEEVELLDAIWPSARKSLNQLLEQDPAAWAASPDKQSFLGVGVLGPEAYKLAITYIMLVTPPILSNIVRLGLSESKEVKKRVSVDLKTYGDVHSVPVHLVKHLENTLPQLLTGIPEEIAETRTCWKILPGGKKKEITIKQSRPLRENKKYTVLIDMLYDPPRLYLGTQRQNVRRKAVKILGVLLKADGKLCTYQKICEDGLGELYVKNIVKYDETIERTITQSLKQPFPLLRKSIVYEKREYQGKQYKEGGFYVTDDLLNYCIIETKELV